MRKFLAYISCLAVMLASVGTLIRKVLYGVDDLRKAVSLQHKYTMENLFIHVCASLIILRWLLRLMPMSAQTKKRF